ncbi:MAG: hypothetical protein RR495_05895 [Anaerovoracaceae bacterium]
MKKIVTVVLSLVLVLGMLTGCGADNSNPDVTALKNKLTTYAEQNIAKHFDYKIDSNDFDIAISEEASDKEFIDLKNIDTINDIYLIGHFKQAPKDITDFVVIYDPSKKEVTKLGIETLKEDGMKYANLTK